MAKPRVDAGGGLPALFYVLRKSREAGGFLRLYRRLRSKNACKTCALGMGGTRGGMVNEAGRFPEVCKKSIQAQAGDMGAVFDEARFSKIALPVLERMSAYDLERLGRITVPMLARRGARTFERISWDDALARTAARFRETTPGRTFIYSSGRSSNEAAFLLQLVARAYGTPHINNCSYYCHSASSVALSQVYGSGTSSLVLEDLSRADLAIVAGANPASNHPRLITQLVHLKRRGGRVIVINPLRELGLTRFRIPSDVRSFLFGSDVCDLYLQPRVGGDIALLRALLKGVVERESIDTEFVARHTEGWEEVAASISRDSWDDLVRESGVPRPEIDQAVDVLAQSKRGIALWAMGLTHHEHGVDNVLALSNLALARGWLGRPGCGLLPIRGHSNVQGVGSVGVSPRLRGAFAKRMEEIYGISPVEGGYDTYTSMLAAERGEMDAALLLGGNLFASNPDRVWAEAALDRVPFKVHLSTKMNEGHVHGRGDETLILPVLARDEEHETTTQESMFNYVRLSEGGTPAVSGEMRSEVEIIAALAERILPEGRFDWAALRSHHSLREQIAAAVPGYAALAQIETTGEFQIPGRTFHEPAFATPSGRARFHSTPIPVLELADDQLRLMTIRSEGQFNTVVYEIEDLYRGNLRRDVVMMAEEDARARSFAEGDAVVVESETGRLRCMVAIVDIRAGSAAMYYPEANVLVPRKLDARSGTPAFKSVIVRVRRAE